MRPEGDVASAPYVEETLEALRAFGHDVRREGRSIAVSRGPSGPTPLRGAGRPLFGRASSGRRGRRRRPRDGPRRVAGVFRRGRACVSRAREHGNRDRGGARRRPRDARGRCPAASRAGPRHGLPRFGPRPGRPRRAGTGREPVRRRRASALQGERSHRRPDCSAHRGRRFRPLERLRPRRHRLRRWPAPRPSFRPSTTTASPWPPRSSRSLAAAISSKTPPASPSPTPRTSAISASRFCVPDLRPRDNLGLNPIVMATAIPATSVERFPLSAGPDRWSDFLLLSHETLPLPVACGREGDWLLVSRQRPPGRPIREGRVPRDLVPHLLLQAAAAMAFFQAHGFGLDEEDLAAARWDRQGGVARLWLSGSPRCLSRGGAGPSASVALSAFLDRLLRRGGRLADREARALAERLESAGGLAATGGVRGRGRRAELRVPRRAAAAGRRGGAPPVTPASSCAARANGRSSSPRARSSRSARRESSRAEDRPSRRARRWRSSPLPRAPRKPRVVCGSSPARTRRAARRSGLPRGSTGGTSSRAAPSRRRRDSFRRRSRCASCPRACRRRRCRTSGAARSSCRAAALRRRCASTSGFRAKPATRRRPRASSCSAAWRARSGRPSRRTRRARRRCPLRRATRRDTRRAQEPPRSAPRSARS